MFCGAFTLVNKKSETCFINSIIRHKTIHGHYLEEENREIEDDSFSMLNAD